MNIIKGVTYRLFHSQSKEWQDEYVKTFYELLLLK